MCGFTGFVGDEKKKKAIIKKMTDRIKHRGPDGEGYYIDDLMAMGHRRLSIIDIANGNQPMFNEDESLVVVFNGEIYNYQELKKELSHHEFKTNADTEVLLHGYEEWGIEMPKKLRGMFSFVIWDQKKKILFGARDPFGIKPFYYYKKDKTFLFGSEIKSFFEHPCFEKKLNEEILAGYLSFSFTPTTETFFEGVNRLDAGNYILYKDGIISIDNYFELTFDKNNDTYEESVDKIAQIMKNSVECHQLSDVKIGSFLSSGIDSSYIVSLAKPENTYTVGYENNKYSEIELAKDLAKKLKIKNKNKIITKEEYLKAIPDIMYYMDEPSSDPAAVALYFVSKLASKDVKVVLSGEGADEFFGGYNFYHFDFKWYNKIPFCIRHAIASFCKLFPEIRGVNFFIRRGEKVEDYYIGVNRVFGTKEKKKVLKNPITLTDKEITKYVYREYEGQEDIIKMQAIDINFWLMKDILQKADRMTMANSIEGRVPFIDTEVFKVARELPLKHKVSKETTKVALRDAAKRVIPNESYKKKKLGFPVPLRDWMREEDFYEEIKKTFESANATEFFNQEYILQLLEEHKETKKDNYRKVWTIYCFLKWYEVFFN
ncbi:MAG: asparagine synthase (glutamine-hydrolyzing) [Bacilli bacterium]|jgi:asparagine synthase (glutamine-hydrolysing)|nr:asparagine synthase (glutamine-hydrolyzing) [Bacilli bacterium]